MITKQHIKQIEIFLNKEIIIDYKLLQISFNIACVKLKLANNKYYIAKFYIHKNLDFNAIISESKNLLYLNKKFKFFPKLIKYNNEFLIIEYLENNNKKPHETREDLIGAIVKLHSILNTNYGFNFNTQIGGVEQINNYENNWANFYAHNRLHPILELANSKYQMGSYINKKIYFLIKNINDFVPNRPAASLLHGDMWEGNILFKNKKFVGFLDPGSFFGHNEMEIAYLRWFNPSFIDSNFLKKYSEHISIDKQYLEYETIYQLYYAICNVALWDKSYINEVKQLLNKVGI